MSDIERSLGARVPVSAQKWFFWQGSGERGFTMDDEKRLLRSVVRQVHPDLFTACPAERNKNSESLKLLNSYLDTVSSDLIPNPITLEFWVKRNETLTPLHVDLIEDGSLFPLFYAFDLITEDELRSRQSGGGASMSDHNLLDWLKETVQQAVQASDQHYALKTQINDLRAILEEKYKLMEIQLGNEFGVSIEEQERQLDSLTVLDQGLAEVCNKKMFFSGLNLCVYHPESCPVDAMCFQSSKSFSIEPAYSRVADDGRIHIVADKEMVREALLGLDIDRARLLTRLSTFWVRRARDLIGSLKDLLHVEDVLCDTSVPENAQKFVLWFGVIVEHRTEIEWMLANRTLNFSLLVHSDTSAPMIDYLAASSILQIRSDCPPTTLLDFLGSETCKAASQDAKEIQDNKGEEEEILERVREALGARHVIRVCSVYERDRVLEAAEKLIENAESIRKYVDLSDVSLAIDNCYQMWESGFISIPFDFRIQDLRPQLQRMLASGESASGTEETDMPSVSEERTEGVTAHAFHSRKFENALYVGISTLGRNRVGGGIRRLHTARVRKLGFGHVQQRCSSFAKLHW